MQPAPAPRFSRTAAEVASAARARRASTPTRSCADWGFDAPTTIDKLRVVPARVGRSKAASMATLVCFHAHPDDESITHRRHDGQAAAPRASGRARGRDRTASTARCPTISADGETLVDRRRAETERSAAVLGVAPRRVARLQGLAG